MDVLSIGFGYIVGATIMYTRQPGDDLCSKSERLKLKWKWLRVAARIGEEELKKWTHFQCSIAEVGEWILEATQLSMGSAVEYEASVLYGTDEIMEDKARYKTRLNAQVAAEKLLVTWLVLQTDLIGNATQGGT